MGLDAVVFCDCVEKKCLKRSHPFPNLLFISPNGSPEIRSRNAAKVDQHDKWMEHACKHEGMMIAGARLGSISGISFLQDAIARAIPTVAQDLPVLWEKVIFDGGHCGDHLSLPDVVRLRQELAELRKVDFKKLKLSESDLDYVEEFQADLASVVKVAIKLKKPIAF